MYQHFSLQHLVKGLFRNFTVSRKNNTSVAFWGHVVVLVSRGSVVGIATRYGLEGTAIKSRWGEIFRTCPDRPWGPPSLLYNGYRGFPGGKNGRGVMLTTHPLLVPRLRKSWAISLLTLWVPLGVFRVSPLVLLPLFMQSHLNSLRIQIRK
jgi:hypothetical protein